MMSCPSVKPESPHFSSGPCKKVPGWHWNLLESAFLGRSHRHPKGFERLVRALKETQTLLEMPPDYHLALVPGSSTGAMEMALWNFLGARGVDCLVFDVFSNRWAESVSQRLKVPSCRILKGLPEELPDLSQVRGDRDLVWVWNGTASGLCVPQGDWIPQQPQGLTICDATSAAFAVKMPWEKLDVVAFSWQKVLGGEASHGMLALSPRAWNHLKTHASPWAIPFLYDLRELPSDPLCAGLIKSKLFHGETLNTPSFLCVEDWLVSLEWGRSIGGLPALIKKTETNAQTLFQGIVSWDWLAPVGKTPEIRSKTSVCLKFTAPEVTQKPLKTHWAFIETFCGFLENASVAYDIKGHTLSDPCLRIWCGPTVETEDIQRLLPWLPWAYQKTLEHYQ